MNAAVLLEVAVVFFFWLIVFIPGLLRNYSAKTMRRRRLCRDRKEAINAGVTVT
jgi:hypothetical protein